MFRHRHDVGQHLRGVPGVGETIPDRDSGVLRELLDAILGEAAEFDSIEHPAEHSAGVSDRLFTTQMGPTWP